MFIILNLAYCGIDTIFTTRREGELRYNNFVCMNNRGIFFCKTEIADYSRELVI